MHPLDHNRRTTLLPSLETPTHEGPNRPRTVGMHEAGPVLPLHNWTSHCESLPLLVAIYVLMFAQDMAIPSSRRIHRDVHIPSSSPLNQNHGTSSLLFLLLWRPLPLGWYVHHLPSSHINDSPLGEQHTELYIPVSSTNISTRYITSTPRHLD